MDDVNATHKEESTFSAFSDTNNSIDTTEIKTTTNNSQATEKNLISEYCPEENIPYESGDNDTTYSHLQANSQFMENNRKYNLNIIPSNGPSTVQKEHLLEMASEVANALTDDMDDSESTLNTLDAKCRYQFVNTYLEEQKQLVNDLHIQVSCYVSVFKFISTLLYTVFCVCVH